MARYAIFAADEIYYGEHGLYATKVIKAFDIDEAKTEGYNLSMEIIQSYPVIYSELEADIRGIYAGSGYDYDKLHDDIYDQDVYYDIYVIDEDKARNWSTGALNQELNEIGIEEFVERFCE